MCSSLTDIMAQIRRTQAICLARSLMSLTAGPEALAVASRAAVTSFPEFDAEALAGMVRADLERTDNPVASGRAETQVNRLSARSMTYAKLLAA